MPSLCGLVAFVVFVAISMFVADRFDLYDAEKFRWRITSSGNSLAYLGFFACGSAAVLSLFFLHC